VGLDINGTRFLLYAKTLGIDFTRTVMVGRQGLYLSRRDLKESFEEFGYTVDDGLVDSFFTGSGGYAEPLLKWLGARDVHSLDYSAYEGATHLHDMNRELPTGFKEQYTTVLDGGTLEHVFNFPVAIRNCMEMVRVGGHYLGITPANNFMGHGFYQFSPELYFSVFTRENGFELISMIAFEDLPRARWYSVRSPREIRHRVTLISKVPVYLLIIAKRVVKTAIFETTPQQSDYLSAWHRRGDASGSALASIRSATGKVSKVDWIKKIVPQRLRRPLRMFLLCFRSGFDSHFFQPTDPTTSMQSPNQ
jgi:hypothetical protein